MYWTELFFDEYDQSLKEFIIKLQDMGIRYQLDYDCYWDDSIPIPCIVVSYEG